MMSQNIYKYAITYRPFIHNIQISCHRQLLVNKIVDDEINVPVFYDDYLIEACRFFPIRFDHRILKGDYLFIYAQTASGMLR